MLISFSRYGDCEAKLVLYRSELFNHTGPKPTIILQDSTHGRANKLDETQNETKLNSTKTNDKTIYTW